MSQTTQPHDAAAPAEAQGAASAASATTSCERTRACATIAPAVDIVEDAEALVVYADLPGVAPDGVSVTLEDQVLTIEGRPSFAFPEGYTAALAEVAPAEYARSFKLAEAIDRASIRAALKDGVLELTLPKAKPQTHTIRVTAG